MRISSTPELKTLYYYLTEGCNLLCRHCWLAPRLDETGTRRPVIDPELVRSTLAQGRELGLSSVKLTGGEPMLHPRFVEIVRHVRDAGVRLLMETNGTRCTSELAELVASCQRPFASISLDGAEPETHEYVRGVPGCWEAALQGARLLTRAGVKTQLILTVMRCNMDQLEALVRLAERVEVSSVKFNVVQPTARGVKMHQQNQTPSVAELIELGHWVERELAHTTPLKLFFSYPLAFRALSAMFDEEGTGCTACGILRILGVLADGSFALCGIGSHIDEMVFGNASRDSLAEVWTHHPVLQRLRRELPAQLGGVCGRCLMKDLCKGACVAQNYYGSRDLLAPYWFCETALQDGLFPETRLVPA